MRQLTSSSPLLGGSPFPPIADYGFLSDCETMALVAPSGNVEWMCLPRVDSPSVFGAILDRDAGAFRLGPSGVTVPAARRYLPGTMVLETSWGTRPGLDHRPRRAADRPLAPRGRRSAHPPPGADRLRRRARAAAHVRCVNGEVQVDAGLRAAVRLRAGTRTWDYTGRRLPPGHRDRRGRPTSGLGPDAPTCASGSRARAPPPGTG